MRAGEIVHTGKAVHAEEALHTGEAPRAGMTVRAGEKARQQDGRADPGRRDREDHPHLPRPGLQGTPRTARVAGVGLPRGVVVVARPLPAQQGQAEVHPRRRVVPAPAQRRAVRPGGPVVVTAQQREVAAQDVGVGLVGGEPDGAAGLRPGLPPPSGDPPQRAREPQPRRPGAGREPYGLSCRRHRLGVAPETLQCRPDEAMPPFVLRIAADRLARRFQRRLRLVARQPGHRDGAPGAGVGAVERGRHRGRVASVDIAPHDRMIRCGRSLA